MDHDFRGYVELADGTAYAIVRSAGICWFWLIS